MTATIPPPAAPSARPRARGVRLVAVGVVLGLLLMGVLLAVRRDDAGRERVPLDLTYSFQHQPDRTLFVLHNPNRGWRLEGQRFSVLLKAENRIQAGYPGLDGPPPGVQCCTIAALGPGESVTFVFPTYVRPPDTAVVQFVGGPGWLPD